MVHLLLTLIILFLDSQVIAKPETKLAVMKISEEGKKWTAPNLEIARFLCLRAQVICDVRALPTHRAFTELQANQVQFLLSLDHQLSGVTYHKIAKVDSVAIVIVAGKPMTDCEAMRGMNFSAFRNVFYAKKLAKKCAGLQFTWTNSYVQGMQMYRSGRVDGMIGVELNFVRSKHDPVRLTELDVVSPVDKEYVWLFSNSLNKSSEAATRFLSVLPKLPGLFQP
ncbi:MAG TPA: hypothetical protein VE954_35925 [Oligoflexus sp.]|uniref:hypothetical protein n=1 Tax=Oligoflexus sp. TaxID=1971216 RepID=UPI002D71A400|nr:hypothetical protein [Oligoflexus sp.]HYX38522.1 hypothetical protein [Oligoflexus sp.]